MANTRHETHMDGHEATIEFARGVVGARAPARIRTAACSDSDSDSDSSSSSSIIAAGRRVGGRRAAGSG